MKKQRTLSTTPNPDEFPLTHWDSERTRQTPRWFRVIANDGIEDSRPSIARIYDFSFKAGIDKWAWDALGIQTPAKPGTPANTSDYVLIATSGDNRWLTAEADEEGEFDTQMYTFTIYENPEEIEAIEVEWEGFGEPQPGYYTTLSVWNYETEEWEPLDARSGMGSERWLKRTITGWISSYVSADGHLTLLAKTKKYVAPVLVEEEVEEVVMPEPDFSISLSPSSAEVHEMHSKAVTVTLTSHHGYTGTVDLSASGQPEGVGGKFQSRECLIIGG
jgi:hypothetical protein